MTGWLAMLRASFAVAPLKRSIIEFPFVAAKAVPFRAKTRSWLAKAVHQKYRLSPHGARD
ncbi:MAG: hypothetical protein ABIT83_24710 [Massilia sp.]